jgi:hypothetical protein
MKTLKHVSTEMALHVLAYNMKRVMRILGVVAPAACMASIVGAISTPALRAVTAALPLACASADSITRLPSPVSFPLQVRRQMPSAAT